VRVRSTLKEEQGTTEETWRRQARGDVFKMRPKKKKIVRGRITKTLQKWGQENARGLESAVRETFSRSRRVRKERRRGGRVPKGKLGGKIMKEATGTSHIWRGSRGK